MWLYWHGLRNMATIRSICRRVICWLLRLLLLRRYTALAIATFVFRESIHRGLVCPSGDPRLRLW